MEYLGLTDVDLELVTGYEALLRKRVLKTNENARLQALLRWTVEHGSIEQLREVLAAGANPNFVYLRSETPLGLLIVGRRDPAAGRELFRGLIEAGADPSRESENQSLMVIACTYGRIWAIEALLDSAPKMLKAHLSKALVVAVQNPALTKRLLDSGADANDRSSHPGMSLLMNACLVGNLEVIESLLAAGADVNLKDDKGHTALDHAVSQKGRSRIIKRLEKAGAVSGRAVSDDGDETAKELAAAAKQPAFKAALIALEKILGAKPERLRGGDGNIPGGYGFPLGKAPGKALAPGRVADFVSQDDEARRFVQEHHAGMLARGFYLFHSRDLLRKNGSLVGLLPTADVYKIVAALETNGSDSTEDLIQWLRALEKDQPVMITGVGVDFVEGTFTTPIKDPAALAKRITRICPEGCSTPDEMAMQIRALSQTKRLFLWWD